MPTNAYPRISFAKGYVPDGGPFSGAENQYRDGLNAQHDVEGVVENRRGIELLSSDDPLQIKNLSDASNVFLASQFYAEFKQNDGSILPATVVRYGASLRVYTSTLDSLDVKVPNYTFTLADVSPEALYYRSNFTQYENTVIITNSRSPHYKLVWGDSTGTETFSVYKIELSEYNDDLFELTRAPEKGKDINGWFSRDIPLKTGETSYTVDFFFSDAVPSYATTVFLVDTDDSVTLVDPTNYTYTETLDTDTDTVTSTLTYSGGTSGQLLRIYFGKTTLSDQNSSLEKETLLVSDQNKNYGADNSYAPRQSALFAGRVVFGGIDGPLDETNDATYPALGVRFNKLWISEMFPSGLGKEELTTLLCKASRSPFDADDNIVAPTEGGIALLDDAARILDYVSYGGSLWVAAANGLWRISAPDDFFHIQQIVIKRILSQSISCREPIVKSDNGIYVATDNDFFFIQAEGEQFKVNNISQNIISSTYKAITEDAKKQSFLRRDEYNKRIYFWYTEDTTKHGQNKYGVAGPADRALVFDENTLAWFAPFDFTVGAWSVLDMVTVPAATYFGATDHRRSEFRKANLVLLCKKNGNFTDLKWGVLEGKPYCADYYGTVWKAAFESFAETTNAFGVQDKRLASKVQVGRLSVFMKRQEKADATSGYYEYPGAVYMWRRWDFADTDTAGPLYENVLNGAQTAWSETHRQIYFPHKLGLASFSGGKPPKTVVVSSQQKLRGRGVTLALRFGNDYGDESLTGTIQEQEKGWGVYGFELDFKEYK